MATISSNRTKLLARFPEPQAALRATVFVESHAELIHRAESPPRLSGSAPATLRQDRAAVTP